VPRRLDYTEDAIEDLKAIRRWLTQPGSGQAARRRLAAITTEIKRLRQHPCLFAPGEHPGVRERPCAGGYRALYEVIPDTGQNETAGDVLILRVYGPGQDRGAR
jgi:plasmid stabilization system protein ParE